MQNPLELYKYLITIAYIGLTTIDENATINEKQQTNKYLKGRWYGYHTRNFNTALLIHVKRNTIRERMIEMHLLPNVYGKDVVKLRDGGFDLDFRSSVFTGIGEVLFTEWNYSVLGTALYLLIHGMIWEALVFLWLKKDICLSSLL